MGAEGAMGHITLETERTDRSPTPAVWAGIDLKEYLAGNGGFAVFDDFMRPLPLFVSAAWIDGYTTYQDTNVTIQSSSTEVGGVLEITGNTTDEDEGHIMWTSEIADFGIVKMTANSGRKVAFECRFKKASVGDNGLAFTIGLTEGTIPQADDLVDADGGWAEAADIIGFRTLHASGEELDVIHAQASATETELSGNVDTLVADTYVKLGIRFDGVTTCDFFVNGVVVATVEVGATNFPDGEELTFGLWTKVGTNAAAVASQLDWWGCAMDE